MKIIELKLENTQRVKFADKVNIERVGKIGQKRTVKRELDGIYLHKGQNKIDDSVYQKVCKSPWFLTLVERGDILVKDAEEKPVEVKKPKKTKTKTKKLIEVESCR